MDDPVLPQEPHEKTNVLGEFNGDFDPAFEDGEPDYASKSSPKDTMAEPSMYPPIKDLHFYNEQLI